jgi:methylated-DNA-[protein]-cysteine S-methyltransferase
MSSYAIFDTAGGFCGIAWSEAGVSRFQLPTDTADATERLLLRKLSDARAQTPPAAIAETIERVKRYFTGESVDFSGVCLDLTGQSAHARDIYAALREVGWGRTTTYGELARAVGAEGWEAARAVGQAMGKNPVALIIPCHRCLAAGGKLGGFSAPGGEFSKLKMLELEGVRPGAAKPPAPEQPSLF